MFTSIYYCDPACICSYMSLQWASEVQVGGVGNSVNVGGFWLLHFHGKYLFCVCVCGGGRGAGLNTLIYTSKPPRHGIVLREEGSRRREGRVMKGALFPLCPSGLGRDGSLWGRHFDGIMMVLNQSHEQMEGFLPQKHGGSSQEHSKVFLRHVFLSVLLQL